MEGTQDFVSFKQMKQWMFQENVRVENEKKELNEMYVKFLEEKKQFQDEMKVLNSKILSERKRLKEESLFFDKKMDILKGGFAQLEADRKKFERERRAYEQEKRDKQEEEKYLTISSMASLLFRGVKNPATLKKRYKDLIKIFHPDNAGGDTETIRIINEV
ncbi:MAG: hypothetical protein GX234_01450 [Clostridiales bacterium]|nr:hypothetical protein [Clostridiales bacterium]